MGNPFSFGHHEHESGTKFFGSTFTLLKCNQKKRDLSSKIGTIFVNDWKDNDNINASKKEQLSSMRDIYDLLQIRWLWWCTYKYGRNRARVDLLPQITYTRSFLRRNGSLLLTPGSPCIWIMSLWNPEMSPLSRCFHYAFYPPPTHILLITSPYRAWTGGCCLYHCDGLSLGKRL